jgi:hypothetical protein
VPAWSKAVFVARDGLVAGNQAEAGGEDVDDGIGGWVAPVRHPPLSPLGKGGGAARDGDPPLFPIPKGGGVAWVGDPPVFLMVGVLGAGVLSVDPEHGAVVAVDGGDRP